MLKSNQSQHANYAEENDVRKYSKIAEESASNTTNTISMNEKYADSGNLVITKVNINAQGRYNKYVEGNKSNDATEKVEENLEKESIENVESGHEEKNVIFQQNS